MKGRKKGNHMAFWEEHSKWKEQQILRLGGNKFKEQRGGQHSRGRANKGESAEPKSKKRARWLEGHESLHGQERAAAFTLMGVSEQSSNKTQLAFGKMSSDCWVQNRL